MDYEWDSKKNRQNVATHGIAFEDAVKIFERPTLERVDDRFDYGETRITPSASSTASKLPSSTLRFPSVDAGSYRLGRQNGMKEKRTGKQSAKDKSDWSRIESLSNQEIRRAIEKDTEARPTDPKFWSTARVVMPKVKQTVTIRLDADLLEWLRRQKGYQTRINAVLRAYMEANPGDPQRPPRP